MSYTQSEYRSLSPEQRQALQMVCETLHGDAYDLDQEIEAEEFDLIFNILRPCEGSVPEDEIGEDVILAVRRKFRSILLTAMLMAEDFDGYCQWQAEVEETYFAEFG